MFTPNYKMSPNLQTYNDLRALKEKESIAGSPALTEARRVWVSSEEHPEKGPIHDAYKQIHDTYHARMKDLAEQIKTAQGACHDAEIGQWWAAWKDWVYADENGKPIGEPDVSPCGRYQLTVSAHPTSPGAWGYTKGKIVDLENLGTEPLEVRRNYSSFWHEWCVKDGKTYLWCGEDYQSYTCVNLSEWTYRTQYIGFCWTGVDVSPDSNLLLAYGCYWGAPYQYKVYDWVDGALWPLIEVGDIQSPYPSDDGGQGVEWLEGGNLRVYVERLCRISDGLDIDEEWGTDKLHEDEAERLENTMLKDHEGEPEAEYRKQWTTWERPTPQKLYEDLCAMHTWRQKLWKKYPDRKGSDSQKATESRIFRQMEMVWDSIPKADRPEQVHP